MPSHQTPVAETVTGERGGEGNEGKGAAVCDAAGAILLLASAV